MSKKKKRTDPRSLNIPYTGVDTHAHLDFKDFAEDLEDVLERAAASGVSRIGQVFLGPEAYEEGSRLFEYPELFFLMGVHPHDASSLSEKRLLHMESLFQRNSRLKAVGEIGLDFFYDNSPREDQIETFKHQCDLALRLDLPVVIHSRDAHGQTLAILEEMGFQGRKVLWHCFGGDGALAEKVISHGWLLSIPGTVTFPKNTLLKEVVKQAGPDSLVLETDCPFLAPVPWRGKRNEPAFTVFTAEVVARELDMDLTALWTRCGQNAITFFGLDPV